MYFTLSNVSGPSTKAILVEYRIRMSFGLILKGLCMHSTDWDSIRYGVPSGKYHTGRSAHAQMIRKCAGGGRGRERDNANLYNK